MTGLNANATFYIIRKYLADAVKPLTDLEAALRGFGREPGESWHAAADEFAQSLEALRLKSTGLKGVASLPAAERKALLDWAERAVPALWSRAAELRLLVLEGCPPLGDMPPPDAAAAAVWAHYDRVMASVMDPLTGREAVQRLLRRAHDPASVIALVFSPADAYAALPRPWEYYSAVNALIHNTPLPHFGGLTILAAMRRRFLEGLQAPGERQEDFEAFVAGVLSPDPQTRKSARKGLEKLREAANGERNSGDKAADFVASRRIRGVWAGVRAALGNPSPSYRRAALCALPVLQFTFVPRDFQEECLEFILSGLRDGDGMVRYKTLRFAADFAMMCRCEEPEVVIKLLDGLKCLLADKAAPAAAKAAARKLMRELSDLRRYDEERGATPAY